MNTKLVIKFFLIFFFCLQSICSKAQCCDYTLSMHDSYGDGWNGASLQVLINNISIGTYSASNFGSTVTLSVCNGDSLDLNYTSGSYENENSYELQDSSWNIVFQDGPNPDTGSVFSSIADCNTPLALGVYPCTAIPIDTGQCVSADNTGSPGSGWNPNCANYQGTDLWFIMQVPPSGNLSFETDSGTINDSGIAVWTDSTCTNLQLLGCDDDGGNGYFSFLTLYDLTPNQTLYIQVWGYGGATGTFQLCVNDLGTVVLDSSELPIVIINTLQQTIIENTKINCLMDIKYNGPNNITYTTDSSNIYSGNIGIEIRGASSASYPQKPYGIETRDSVGSNNNVSILGMPAENDWVLLSNYNDLSLIRNALAFKLFGDMGNYSVRASLCEVVIDSSYKGIYLLGEKIKRDNNRVAISKLTATDTTGDNLTGGYILQQNYWNSSNSFQSNYSPIDHPGFDVHFVYEYPKPNVILPQQKTYIASYIDSLETALYSTDFTNTTTGYRRLLDVKSFIDYFLVNELSRNADGFKKSVFFNKNKYSNGGKLNAGPVWDFDWAWKNLGICNIYNNSNGTGWAHHNNDCPTDNYSTGWYIRLLQDSTFNNELRCTYENYRQTILDTTYIFTYIDSIKNLVQFAHERHFKKWPILGMSGPAPEIGAIATTYNAELDTLKGWINLRLQWLDANIPGICSNTGVSTFNISNGIKCYPNPTNNYFNIEYSLSAPTNVSFIIYNYLGAEVLSIKKERQNNGQHSLKLETINLLPGIYILKIQRGEDILTKKIVVSR
jgi:hypothetical protein